MRQHRSRPRPDITLGDRAAAAFGSLPFSGALFGLLWLLFNSRWAVFADSALPVSWLVGAIAGFAVLSFLFPRAAASLFGGLFEALLSLGRWW